MSNVLRPLFIAVTWGAGGCTSSRSLELAELCQRQLGVTTCLHLTCTNMKRALVDETLEEAKVLGVRNILALRGDPPRDEYRPANGIDAEEDSNVDFKWAIDLVRYIRSKYGDYFCIGVAAYPEGHSDLSYPMDQDPIHDLSYLIEKVKAGADFIMTQLFYDVTAYIKFERMLREHDSAVFKGIPIIPGLMPIQSFEIMKRTAKLSHAKLPQELVQRLEPIKGDDAAVKKVGVGAVSEMIKNIKAVKSTGPRGFHFFTLNLEKAVSEILDRCQLVPPEPVSESAISDTDGLMRSLDSLDAFRKRTMSSSSASAVAQLTTNSHRSSSPPQSGTPTVAVNGNPISREATWDDYPNGRFGDARSPAFNAPLTYSPTCEYKSLFSSFDPRNVTRSSSSAKAAVFVFPSVCPLSNSPQLRNCKHVYHIQSSLTHPHSPHCLPNPRPEPLGHPHQHRRHKLPFRLTPNPESTAPTPLVRSRNALPGNRPHKKRTHHPHRKEGLLDNRLPARRRRHPILRPNPRLGTPGWLRLPKGLCGVFRGVVHLRAHAETASGEPEL